MYFTLKGGGNARTQAGKDLIRAVFYRYHGLFCQPGSCHRLTRFYQRAPQLQTGQA